MQQTVWLYKSLLYPQCLAQSKWLNNLSNESSNEWIMQISLFSIPYTLMIKSNQTNCSFLSLPSLPLKPGFGCPPMTRNTSVCITHQLNISFSESVKWSPLEHFPRQSQPSSPVFPRQSVPANYQNPVTFNVHVWAPSGDMRLYTSYPLLFP